MKHKITIFRMLILFNIYLISCGPEKNVIEVKIQAISKTNNLPRRNIKVKILKVENPMFSMRSFILVDTLRTDDNGFISFKTNKMGHYSIRFYKDNEIAPFYWIDTLKIKSLDKNRSFQLIW